MAIDHMKVDVQALIDGWHSNRTAQSIADELGITHKSLRNRWEILKQNGKLPRDRKARAVEVAKKGGMQLSNRTSVVGDPEPEDIFDGRPRSTEKINKRFLALLRREAKKNETGAGRRVR
jgi:hypothetical protein